MPTKYTPATFQPTVRPSWGGILSYIGEKEKAEILEAIIKFPMGEPIKSKFWEETIKPDLEQQYEKFKTTCIARGRGAQTYWGEHKLSLSITQGKDKDNSLKDKDKDKGKSKDKDKSITPYNNIINNYNRDVDNVDNFAQRQELAKKIGGLIKRVPKSPYDYK